MLPSRATVYLHCTCRQVDVGAKREITLLCSEDQIDAAIDATNVARIGAAQRQRLCSERDTRFVSRFEYDVAVQRIANRPPNVDVGLHERQSLLCFVGQERDVGSGDALDGEKSVLRQFDQGPCGLLRLGID